MASDTAHDRPASRLGPLGILGGGQLARMTIEAASPLGIDVVIAERFADAPAARLTDQSLVFPHGWDDAERLRAVAERAPVVTLESEFVDAAALARLETFGARVLPSPDCVRVVQDKLWQKQALAEAGLPVPAFRAVEGPDDLVALGRDLGWPLMLKARRDGYDGRGNALVRTPEGAADACAALGWPERTLYAEAFVPFERELATLVVRGLDGETVVYPVVESQQDPALHICRVVLAPAPVAEPVAREAARIARAAAEAVGVVGALGVEMFLSPDGAVAVNELAPRPHNTAHYSIEACVTSQFANHVRAVLGLPLGDPALRRPAVMVNLLGEGRPAPSSADLAAALAVPEAYVHLYGKRESRPGRKMGHVTALGATLDEALTRATRAAEALPT